MSKEPIELGLSVERHTHHHASDHHHDSDEEETIANQRINKQFTPDSLSTGEQIALYLFGSLMIVIFIAVLVFVLIS